MTFGESTRIASSIGHLTRRYDRVSVANLEAVMVPVTRLVPSSFVLSPKLWGMRPEKEESLFDPLLLL